MKKFFIFFNALCLSLSVGFTANAKSVDENTAKIIGSNYLISNNIPGAKASADLVTTYKATAQINGQTVVDYYVFAFTGGKGFIMVSGDDKVIPILAVSGQSDFDLNNMAPATKNWIEGYQNQITYVITHDLPAKAGTSDKWNNLVAPQPAVKSNRDARTTSLFPSSDTFLCHTTWDQDPATGVAGSYNGLCPSGTGGRAVTGCVATAMAQLMKYWAWPNVGTGSHTYTQNPDTYGYPAQTADFGNTYYNWAGMPNTFASGTNLPIETLMYDAGVSVEMNYGPVSSADGSGSYVTKSETPVVACAEYALPTYFHYKRSLYSQLRDGTTSAFGAFYIPAQAAYAEAAWITLLKNELNAGRPMLYKGQEASGGGHCWVCDGYNSSSMFHFNWGWSGESNGWYTVDNLAPPALGTGAGSGNFNTDQGIILNIEPDTYPAIAAGKMQMAAHLDCAASSAIPYSTAFSIVTKITNTNTTAFTGSYCVQVFDTLNNLVGTVQTLTSQSLAAGASSAALTFSTAGMPNLIPSEYHFEVMYKSTSGTTWTPVANYDSLLNYNMLAVGNTNGLELYAAISVPAGTTVNIGSALSLNTEVVNFSNANFSGSLQAVLTNIVTGTKYPVQVLTGITIDTFTYGGPFTFSISAITAPIGNYVLAIEHQPGGTGTYYVTGSDYFENPIFVTVISKEAVAAPLSVADNISVYPNPANDIINIAAQGVSINTIRITDIRGREMMTMAPAISQSVISIPVSSFAEGVYLVQLQTETGSVTKKIVIAK
jgi:hypothetical protein